MAGPDAKTVKVGDRLPGIETGTITRHMIALYAAGSGDLNPVHVDTDFARAAGLDDVIVHGMYSMGCLGRLVAEWAGPESVRSIETRFEAMLPARSALVCEGEVTAIAPSAGHALVTISLLAKKPDGTRISSGSAIVQLPLAA